MPKFNEDGTTDTFYTNEDGYLITSERLSYGNYELIEVQAPEGYILAKEPVTFKVDGFNDGLIEIRFEDMSQKGIVNFTKTGQKPVGVKTIESDYGMVYKFVFDYKPIADVTYRIEAVEDTVMIHVDEAGNRVIIKNPTMDNKPDKSEYQPKQTESDGTVDAQTSEEITDFLETFFKLYPSATEKELSYYVSNQALNVIDKNYVFSELLNPVYVIEDDNVIVSVTVKYLDQETKVSHYSQFELTLQKQDNWKIIK